jgi:hypothetical protein
VFNKFEHNQSPRAAERRSASRFPLKLAVNCKVLNKRDRQLDASGSTVDLSSTGVLFTTDQVLVPGKRIELSISWPAKLNDKCRMLLVAKGRVTRTEDGKVAMEIQQHEFRTTADRSAAAGAGAE